MNTKNNKRAQETDEAIVRTVFEIIWKEHCPISKITVRKVCEKAKINRSTFYAHYQDMFDVVEKVEENMAKMHHARLMTVFQTGGGFREAIESVFEHVREYREFYFLYFGDSNRMSHLIEILHLPFQKQLRQVREIDMGYGVPEEGDYHFRFFTAGITSLLTVWVNRGCRETPAELYEILEREYGGNSMFRIWSGLDGTV